MKNKRTLTIAALVVLSPLLVSGIIHYLKKRDTRIEMNSNKENEGHLILKEASK